MRPRDNSRDVAALVIGRVIHEDAFSNMALRTALQDFPMERRDRAFTTRLTYGTLTWKPLIDRVLDALLSEGLRSLDEPAQNHLRIAMFQLLKDAEHTPAHAAIDGCVDLVGTDSPHLRGLANGVLRNFLRQKDELLPRIARKHPAAYRYGLSKHVANILERRLEAPQIDRIMERWNQATPVAIRARKGAREAVIEQFADDESIRLAPHPIAPDALIFEGDIRTIVRKHETLAVQDAGAQLATHTFPPDLRGLVADVCAGLGGKSLHLLDNFENIELAACDISGNKLKRIHALPYADRFERIHANMATYEGAEKLALHAASKGYEEGLSAILIDAPCSALGTLGRHPEVRWNRAQTGTRELLKTQQQLLDTASQLLQPGGYLTYVVCTFSEEETITQIDRFLTKHPEFELAPPDSQTADPRIDWSTLVDPTQTISLWPVPHQSDGFFIARLQRRAG